LDKQLHPAHCAVLNSVSYRDHAVPTVLKLREAAYKLGFASKARAVKQWQKLIQLGLEHVFHAVTISEGTGSEALTVDKLSKTLERLGNVKPELSVLVGSGLTKEIALANAVKMTTARIKTGAHRTSTPKAPDETPAFEISKLSDILEILRTSK